MQNDIIWNHVNLGRNITPGNVDHKFKNCQNKFNKH